MNEFVARPLDDSTWPDFARLVDRHNGVWGGCWCMAFHSEGVGKGKTQEQNRLNKEVRVREGRAHAALVYEGDDCVGWCQFGPTSELPRIKHRRVYESGLAALPARRRHGRELPRGDGWSDDFGRVPLQRDSLRVRASRLRTNPSDWQTPLGNDDDRA